MCIRIIDFVDKVKCYLNWKIHTDRAFKKVWDFILFTYLFVFIFSTGFEQVEIPAFAIIGGGIFIVIFVMVSLFADFIMVVRAENILKLSEAREGECVILALDERKISVDALLKAAAKKSKPKKAPAKKTSTFVYGKRVAKR